MKKERTPAYRMTVQSKDDPRVQAVRDEVKALNKDSKWEDYEAHWTKPGTKIKKGWRLSFKGRAGKNNPHGITRTQMSDGSIPHAKAQYFDVYVHGETRVKYPKEDKVEQKRHDMAPPPTPQEFRLGELEWRLHGDLRSFFAAQAEIASYRGISREETLFLLKKVVSEM